MCLIREENEENKMLLNVKNVCGAIIKLSQMEKHGKARKIYRFFVIKNEGRNKQRICELYVCGFSYFM
jgi:D-Tyr-tRNAtyr deacylase